MDTRSNCKTTHELSAAQSVGTPNPWVIQGSTVYTRVYYSAVKERKEERERERGREGGKEGRKERGRQKGRKSCQCNSIGGPGGK